MTTSAITYDLHQPEQQVLLAITNPRFVDHLLELGYPLPDEKPGDFPSVADSFQKEFLRGFLESSGYFSTGGWDITVENSQRAETLQE